MLCRFYKQCLFIRCHTEVMCKKQLFIRCETVGIYHTKNTWVNWSQYKRRVQQSFKVLLEHHNKWRHRLDVLESGSLKQTRKREKRSVREREREREREKISNQCNESKSVKEDQLKVEVDLPQWCSQQSCFLQSRELTDGSQPNLPSNGSCFHPINNTEKNNIIGWNYLSVLYNENSYNCKAIMNTQWERERERERETKNNQTVWQLVNPGITGRVAAKWNVITNKRKLREERCRTSEWMFRLTSVNTFVKYKLRLLFFWI
jgi:hypothetical protein